MLIKITKMGGAGKMAPRVKWARVLAAKPVGSISVAGIHMLAGEKQFPDVVQCYMCGPI